MDPEQRKKQKFENQTLKELCQNRKKENFEQLKNWDQQRAHYLVTHRRVADEMDEVIQNRVKESDEFVRVVKQFLWDISEQQKRYESESVSNPELKLKNNAISKNIQISTSKCLQGVYQKTQNFKNFRKSKLILEEGIKAIEDLLAESEREIMELRTRVQMQVVEIQNINAETSHKCDRVVDFYKQDRAAKIFQSDIDLFQLQNAFIQQASEQTQTQSTFGSIVVDMLDCAEKYQRQKLSLVKQVLSKYLSAMAQIREDNEGIKSLFDILQKQTEEQYIKMLYSSEELISKEMMKEVKKVESRLQSEDIDIKEIRTMLKHLKFPQFDHRHLILKQYRIYLKNEQELQNCMLVVTVDGFLHVYQNKGEEDINGHINSDYSLALAHNLQMEREGDIRLTLMVRKSQILAFGKAESGTLNLVFMNEDQREEFLEFVHKMMPV